MELAAEASGLHARLEAAVAAAFPPAPACVLTVRAGAGGADAEDWTAQLEAMYGAWARRRGARVRAVERCEGRAGGLRSATLLVTAPWAHALLAGEAGSHRVAHHSRHGAKGKRQTSFCSVEALAHQPAACTALDRSQVRVEAYAGSSKGGQHANRSATNIRAVHLPTGLSARSQGRSKEANRKAALAVLASRVRAAELERSDPGRIAGAGFGGRARSYTFTPYQLVADERTGVKTRQLDAVLAGGPELDVLMLAAAARRGADG